MAVREEEVAPGRIRSVQGLRALAALFVVATHATLLWHDRFDGHAVAWENGNAGVDLFFVISGFIMVVSCRRLRTRKDGWWRFAVLRLIRIVPLYWGLTAVKLAILLAAPGAALHTRPTSWNIAASFLFIPSRDGAGDIRPVLPVGWTLSFEMLFYAVFAVALFAGVDALLVVAPVMGLLAGASLLVPDGAPAWLSWAHPMVLEFVFGVLIGAAFTRGWLARRAPVWALLLAATGLVCLGLVPSDESGWRVLAWGVPAAVALAAVVSAERWIDRFLPAWVVRIGEASYSLYLLHGFIIPVVGWAIARLGWGGAGAGLLVGASMLASVAASLVLFQWVELPVTAALRGRKTLLFRPKKQQKDWYQLRPR